MHSFIHASPNWNPLDLIVTVRMWDALMDARVIIISVVKRQQIGLNVFHSFERIRNLSVQHIINRTRITV